VTQINADASCWNYTSDYLLYGESNLQDNFPADGRRSV